jgi:hypothetical protein
MDRAMQTLGRNGARRKGTNHMNVNTLGTTSVVGGASTAADVSDASSTIASADLDALGVASQSSISPEGGLFGELASLSQSDPSKFKKVATEISQKLKDAATQATGDQAKFLTKMAGKFDQAAQTGDMSVLKPEGPGGAHGHHHRKHDTGQGNAPSSPFGVLSQIISSSLQDVTATSAASQA